MKCPKCGKEWNQFNTIASNTYICPFCGDNFGSDGDKREDFQQVMTDLVASHGIDLLEDTSRLNAFLMDLAPRSEKERKLVIMVLREGVLSQIMKLINEDESNQKFGINRCVKQLVLDIWITEVAARYAVFVIANCVGIKVELDVSNSTNNAGSTSSESETTSDKIMTKDFGLVSEDAINYALKDCNAIGFKAIAANKNIESLRIPDNVIFIYPKAFLNCINLKSVEFSKNMKNIGAGAFEGCCSLEKIEVEEGASFKVINGMLIDKLEKKLLRVLNKPSFVEVAIPNGIVTICKKAFERANVQTVHLPMSVKNIEEEAFFLVQSLKRYTVDSKNMFFRTIGDVLYDRQGKKLISYPQGKSNINYNIEDLVERIETQAFSCCGNLQSITFPSSVKTIGFKAFEYCISLENIILPQSIETIEDRAFQYCNNLKGIMLSSHIQQIGDCAFYGCKRLETISVPKSVKRIGNLSFAYCTSVKSVVIQENVEFIGDGAFAGCENVEIIIKDNRYVESYCNARGIKCKKM